MKDSKTMLVMSATAAALMAPMVPHAVSARDKVVGVQPIDYTVVEKSVMPTGFSVTKSILDKDVYNAKNEKVGKVDDLIVATDKQVTFAVIGAGGFLGMDTHNVAIPVRLLQINPDGKIIFKEATKQALMNLPEFKYTR